MEGCRELSRRAPSCGNGALCGGGSDSVNCSDTWVCRAMSLQTQLDDSLQKPQESIPPSYSSLLPFEMSNILLDMRASWEGSGEKLVWEEGCDDDTDDAGEGASYEPCGDIDVMSLLGGSGVTLDFFLDN